MRRLVNVVRGLDFLAMLAWTTSPATWATSSRLGSSRRDVLADHETTVGRRAPGLAGAGARPRTAAELGGGHRDLPQGRGALAQPDRVQPPAPALRAPLQADPPLPGPELPRRPAAAAAGTGDRPLRRGPRADPDPLRRSRAPRAAGSPRARQPGSRAARPACSSNTNVGRAAPERVTWLREQLREHEGPARGPRPEPRRSRSPCPPASSPARASSCRRPPCSSSSPAAPATPSTTSPATSRPTSSKTCTR